MSYPYYSQPSILFLRDKFPVSYHLSNLEIKAMWNIQEILHTLSKLTVLRVKTLQLCHNTSQLFLQTSKKWRNLSTSLLEWDNGKQEGCWDSVARCLPWAKPLTIKKFLCPRPREQNYSEVQCNLTPSSLAEKRHNPGIGSLGQGHRHHRHLPTVVIPTALLQLPRSDATSYHHIATHDL